MSGEGWCRSEEFGKLLYGQKVGPCPLSSRKQIKVFLRQSVLGGLVFSDKSGDTAWSLDWSEDRLGASWAVSPW